MPSCFEKFDFLFLDGVSSKLAKSWTNVVVDFYTDLDKGSEDVASMMSFRKTLLIPLEKLTLIVRLQPIGEWITCQMKM